MPDGGERITLEKGACSRLRAGEPAVRLQRITLGKGVLNRAKGPRTSKWERTGRAVTLFDGRFADNNRR